MKVFSNALLWVTFATFLATPVVAQEFDITKATGKWIIDDIVYNLSGRSVEGESLPPSEEGTAMWNQLNSDKANTIADYKKQQYSFEIKGASGADATMTESYNSTVFGPKKATFYVVFSPNSTYFSNYSIVAPSNLYPSLEGDKLKISTPNDANGISTTYIFKRTK